MKKITTLILAFACFAMTSSFSQSVLFIENGTPFDIEVILYSYDINTSVYNGNQTINVPAGASIPVNSVNATSEWVLAEFQEIGCGSQLAVQSDGLNGSCYPISGFGYPSNVMYNLCGNPFKALWNSYCGSNNPHLHFYD